MVVVWEGVRNTEVGWVGSFLMQGGKLVWVVLGLKDFFSIGKNAAV